MSSERLSPINFISGAEDKFGHPEPFVKSTSGIPDIYVMPWLSDIDRGGGFYVLWEYRTIAPNFISNGVKDSRKCRKECIFALVSSKVGSVRNFRRSRVKSMEIGHEGILSGGQKSKIVNNSEISQVASKCFRKNKMFRVKGNEKQLRKNKKFTMHWRQDLKADSLHELWVGHRICTKSLGYSHTSLNFKTSLLVSYIQG